MNISVYTRISASTIHPHVLLLATADIVLDVITLFPRCPPPMKSNTWGSIWTLSPLVAKTSAIAFRKQFQPPNCCDHFFRTRHFPLHGNSRYIAPLCYLFSRTPWIVRFFLPPQKQNMNTVHFKSLRRVFKISSIIEFWNLPTPIAPTNIWQV